MSLAVPADTGSVEWEELRACLGDRRWRLNHLYRIQNKAGKEVPFRLNRAQKQLLAELHHRTVILKARQLGFSTLILLYGLDLCLFNSHQSFGVVAHNREDAEDLFRSKIKFAVDRLPSELREALAPEQNSARKLEFPNGSTITVGTSLRSATHQMVHVSEYGKISARYPDKAQEIQTGALETVPKDGLIVIESTAEGREGPYYRLVQAARALADAGARLGPLDYRFHFSPWWEEPGYRADPRDALVRPALQEYFHALERDHGIVLDQEQRAWYALKRDGRGGGEGLGDELMKREYPSHPDEAFEVAILGAYYAKQFQELRRQGRITSVPHTSGLPVITAWDLGMSDSTAIWWAQVRGREVRLIDYYEASGEGLMHYAQVLRERAERHGYQYARHLAPHDIEVRDLSAGGQSRREIALELGIRFEVVEAVPTNRVVDAIEPVRQFLPLCWFDAEATAEGRLALEHYRREWDERRGTYRDRPLHDWASHGAKAFETLARGGVFGEHLARVTPVTRPDPRGWT